MDYQNDKRVILTLDAGGTNFVFSAMQSGKEIVEAYTLPSMAACLDDCLGQLVKGFEHVASAGRTFRHQLCLSRSRRL